MTQAEKETIEIFCREFTQAFQRITGNMVIIDPDLLARQVENDLHPDKDQILQGDHNLMNTNECSDGIDNFSRLRPTSYNGQDLEVKNHHGNSDKS